ncbi:MAG: sulfotransferase family 2 domain-containing protein [Rhodobacteraceae bacterium]|nr:sulfotransferase family 2 domain-containing protein [Paracoccaceae bacterium]
MISHFSRCIFVHQKKVAGTSIKRLFQDFTPGTTDGSYLSDGIMDPNWEKSEYVSKYFSFTVVRNPWDRFVSGWLYCQRTKNRTIVEVLRNLPKEHISWRNPLQSGLNLQDRKYFVAELGSRSVLNIRRFLYRDQNPGNSWSSHDYVHITRQQCRSILDSEGSLIVDKILFYEDLKCGILELEKAVGVKLRSLPENNVNRHRRDYREYFNRESLLLFEDAFGEDIEFLGYDFDSGQRSKPIQNGRDTAAT